MVDVKRFWKAIVEQDADTIRDFFMETATVTWYNTNEKFTLEEFIRVNCEYPGAWNGKVERIEKIGNLTITVTRVFSKDNSLSCHVTSFIKTEEDKISSIDEYWGDDGVIPQWRLDKRIGTVIR